MDDLDKKKILIINIFGVGDVLFTTPVITNIKTKFPSAFIGYVCNRRTEPLLLLNPKVDKVFVYEKDEFAEAFRRSKRGFLKRISGLLDEIKKEQFDVVLDLSLNKYASFFMKMAGIRERIGYNFKNRSPFLTRKIKFEGYEGRHVVEYYLDLLKELGIPPEQKNLEFFVPEKERLWAQSVLSQNGIKPNDMVVGVVPGGGASWGKDAVFKRWPAEKYAVFMDKIIENFSVKIILLGSPGERSLCERVASMMRRNTVQMGGMTDLLQFAALLQQCKLAVANDGGPLHVASAVGTRTLSIFGPVDERVYGPYPRSRHMIVTKQIPCRPCYHKFKRAECEHQRCINTITVEEVVSKFKDMLTNY